MLNVRIADAEEASTRNTGTNNWCLQHPGAGEQPEPRLYGANASGIPCVCVSVLAALRQHYSTFALVCGPAEGFQVSGYVRSFPPHIHNDTANMCLGFRLEIFISIPATWLSRARVCTIPNKFCSHRKHSFWFGKGRRKKTVWSNNTRRSRSLGYIHGYENRNETFHMGVSFGSRFFTWLIFPTCPASVNSRVSEKRTLGTMSEAYWINFDSFAVEEQ